MTVLPITFLLTASALCSGTVYRGKQSIPSCTNTGIREVDRKIFLDFHNAARRRVAKGQEPNKNGNLNSARNMHKLKWNCDLEQTVQDVIKNCPTSPKTWSGLGQNLIKWNIPGFNEPHALIEVSLESWWGAVKNFGVGSENRYDNAALYNFANMIFANTTEVGCAYQSCNDGVTVSCLYNAIGFYDNEPMWETGKSCTKNDECTVYPKSKCEDGLCIKGGDIIETNNICPKNEGMPDSVRKTMLDLHNQLRSSLARGLERDGLGGNAPKAKYMLKMNYDCEVEASAMKNAKKCVYRHTDWSERRGLGENIGAFSYLNYDKNKAATEMVANQWWAELAQFGVGPNVTYDQKLWSRPGVQIGHYTQMAWESTYRLGCSVEHCPKMTYVVCQYGPAGNAPYMKIYTVGEPCQDDSGCPSGSTCSVAEGLCVVPEGKLLK